MCHEGANTDHRTKRLNDVPSRQENIFFFSNLGMKFSVFIFVFRFGLL